MRKFTMLITLFSVFLNFHKLDAIKVNGQEMTDNAFTYTNPTTVNHIGFRFSANEISLGSLPEIDGQWPKLSGFYREILPRLGKIFMTESLNLTCPHTQGQHLRSPIVNLSSTPDSETPGLTLKSCVVESPQFTVTSDRIEFDGSFIKSGHPFVLRPKTPNTQVTEIQITPYDTTGIYPMYIQGAVDFTGHSTGAKQNGFFIVTGARKIRMIVSKPNQSEPSLSAFSNSRLR